MSANTEHPAFNQPQSENLKIWRYMDFTKFVSLISSGKLYLTRADIFEDSFEGSTPKKNYETRLEAFCKISNISKDHYVHKNLSDTLEAHKQFAYINCWHLSEYESYAMWKIYSYSNESIAIQTSYDKLKQVLPEDVYLGVVSYIDYKTETIPEKYALYEPFMHKRKSFEYEKEVRVFKMIITDPSNMKGNHKEGFYVEGQPLGVNIGIDLNKLIEKIYINPKAPDWFSNLVKEVTIKYEINTEIIKSDLYSDPVY